MKSKKVGNANMYTYHIKEMMFVSSFKMSTVKFCIITALLLFVTLISILPFILNSKSKTNQRPARFSPDLKYILFWNQPTVKKVSSFHVKYVPEFEVGQKVFIEQKCPHYNCYIAYNDSLLNGQQSNYDAVVFNVHDIRNLEYAELNFTRSPSQKFIFRSHESSEKHPVCSSAFDDFFNWTWTYKLNSDIPHPFIDIYDVNNKLVGPNTSMDWVKNMNHSTATITELSRKNKAVMWVVNKCKLKSQHQDFVSELREELKGYNYTVDLYGSCGDKKCPGGLLSRCYKKAEKEYFFQMVVEDYSVEDYVTERIVKALGYFTVPIVLGGVDYTRFIPPGAFINARAFDIKKLGALIDYLIRNPMVYKYFFDWKNHYFYTTRHRSNVCGLCAKLNGNTDVYDNYTNFRQWWHVDYKDVCERMQLYRLFET